MLRTVLTILLPFLTPFVCYAVWAWFAARKREKLEHGEALDAWQKWPWSWLIISGGALAGISVAVLFLTGDGLPGENQRWVAPQVIDGEVVPGHYEPIPQPVED